MLRLWFGASLAVLVVAGVTLAEEKKEDKAAQKGKVAFGKIVSLEIKDGVGTLTVLARKGSDTAAEPKEMKLKITKDTKFMKGATRDAEGTAVESDKLADTFKKDVNVYVRYEGDDASMTAIRVNIPAPRINPPQPKDK